MSQTGVLGGHHVAAFDAGIPIGTAALALRHACRAATAATALGGTRYAIDEVAVLAHILLPLLVRDPVAPPAPRPAPGGGHVHADVSPDDEELLAVVLEAEPHADAERTSTLAQECRLAVTPYRPPHPAARQATRTTPPRCGVRALDGVHIVDLSAMWAGPLCTMLLAECGAQVVTVEPAVRPDGLRGSPAQFAALDRGKTREPWDLRVPAERHAFEQLLATADVLVESFSERVMPNLGYGSEELAAINPELVHVAVRAFPAGGPEASWVAYGRGVHAAIGLGLVKGVPRPALIAYPDPLAGLVACAEVLAALARPGHAGPVRVDVSLAAAAAPLVATAGGRPLGDVHDDALCWLREATGRRPGPVLVAR